MAKRQTKIERPYKDRRYRKLFVLAVEGRKTEQEYFAIFTQKGSVVKVECLPSGSNCSPGKVLRRMAARLRKEALKPSDEAWLVVDRDEWQDEQLSPLHAWTKQKANYSLAVSNPKFEYWLVLHFEDGRGVVTARDCDARLRQYLPDYDKGIDGKKITPERIDQAIRRARLRDDPPCEDWPRKTGSTVYKLAASILAAQTRD